MTPELKQKWIEALRSGTYEQAQLTLNDGRGFCCLGVLCDVSNLGSWDGNQFAVDRSADDPAYDWVERLENDLAEIGDSVFGLPNEIEAGCVALNDIECATFPQIANWLENHL